MLLLQRIGAAFLIASTLLAPGGGMHVNRSADSTWLKVNLMHASAGIVFLLGTLSCVVASFLGGERSGASPPSA